MHKSQGFTLIELMVVIAVLAIMLALASPSFADFFQRYRLRGAADKVVTLLASARAESVMRNRDVSIDFKGAGGGWCVGAKATPDPEIPGNLVGSAASCDCNADATQCTLSDSRTLVVASTEVSGVTIGAVPGTLVFSSKNGAMLPIGSTAQTTLKSPNGKYTLRLDVSALGRASLCVPDGQPVMAGFVACN